MTRLRTVKREQNTICLASLIERADPIPFDTGLRDAIEMFRRFPKLRFLAVVDTRGRPIGAVHEQLIRDLLFSPFGHALLANPGCPWTLEKMVQPCPIADIGQSIDAMVASHSSGLSAEGLIVTRNGRYEALLPAQGLLLLSAERDRRNHEQRIAEAEAAIGRAESLRRAFDGFRKRVLEFSDGLGEAADEMRSVADEVAEGAGKNGKQATSVAAAARQSFDSISEVAQSSVELARQSKLIEDRAIETNAAMERAVGHVSDTAEKTRILADAADDIGETVGMISDIAAQVNMLAINARIEAARAGAAGQSFGVVAGEVKALAVKAGVAARDIAERVHSVRAAIRESAAANQAIETIVASLADVARGIREAVLQQSSATDQIASSAEECARSSGEISRDITDMGERASMAGSMAGRLGDVACGLGGRAAALCETVEDFLLEVRALSGHAQREDLASAVPLT